jgi:hypothetical protein
MIPDDVQVLIYRVRSSGIPIAFYTLLRRQQFNELAELATEETPATLDMQNQRVCLVLGQHGDAADTGVDAVGQREIDDTELATEWDCRLGAPTGQMLESRSAPTSKDEGERVTCQSTDKTLIPIQTHGNMVFLW